MKLNSIGEDALVSLLTKGLSLGDHVVAGAGDDCAVLRSGGRRGEWQLFKTDCIVEGVHFLSDADPAQVGWKAIGRPISDIAAMGGVPTDAVVTIVLPRDRAVGYVEKLYAGIRRAAEAFGVSIVGGETSSSLGCADGAGGGSAVISISLLGRVESRFCTFRSGGQKGDAIFVTGRLGGSIGGHHLTFVPRLREARWLVRHFRIRAMMDLSDGLAKDLPRLAAASGLDFEIKPENVPRNEGCAIGQALADGEDYELLFTLSPRRAGALIKAWEAKFPEVEISRIGRLVEAVGARNHSELEGGWDHFENKGDPSPSGEL